MKLKKAFSTVLVTGALLAAGSASAQAFPDFTVDPDLLPGTPNSFTADKITGNYTESITLNAGNTFSFSLHWDAGQFVANDGATPVFGTGLTNTYLLYANYSGTGTYTTPSAGVATFTADPGGLLSVFRSPDLIIGGDTLIATGVGTNGGGTLDTTLSTCSAGGGVGINCGSFGQNTTFALTAAGSTFFTNPVPFYNLAFDSGQFNFINLATIGTAQTTNGSLDVVFGRVPEPTSIALLGLALLGLGFTQRRKA